MKKLAIVLGLSSVAWFGEGSPAQADGEPARQRDYFLRGDPNGDARLDIGDPLFTLHFLYAGGPRGGCDDAADFNDDGFLDIADALSMLVYLFLSGPQPPAPGLACGTDPSADGLGCLQHGPCGGLRSPDLLPTEGCPGVLEDLKTKLTENMEKTLEEGLALALEVGDGGGPGCGRFLAFADDEVGPVPPAGAGTPAQDGPGEFSGTNNQVAGVDEPDFIKTDGSFIYAVSGRLFQVLDSWPPQEARVIASLEVRGEPRRLFVHGDRAVVYSARESIHLPRGQDAGPWSGPVYGECTYGYDCDFTGDGRRLQVTVLDISDRAQPRVLREIEFSGSYLNARRIGDMVHTVVIFPEAVLPGLAYWPEELGSYWDFCFRTRSSFTDDQVRAAFAALRERNLQSIEQVTLADMLPGMRDTRYDGESPVTSETLFGDCRGFFLDQSGEGQSFLSLITFEVGELEDLQATTILGKPGAVYASRDSLYIATRQYRGLPENAWYFPSQEGISEATTVHKFQLLYDRAGSSYLGSGVVKGRVLNQFSMDEHEGHLRIATTTGHLPSPEVHSTVSVLSQDGQGLSRVGQVDRLAPGEDIRSVRFSGSQGYVVTFKKTDPLFVLDLSNPQDPAVRGELKIPGFSTYMHVLEGGRLLSIGYDAEDHGNFAFFQGILLQLFDVGDLENPRLLHREVIGTRGSTSDAATDHLAFNYLASRSLLALPMVICESSDGGGNFGTRLTFNGLLVYRVDAESGFQSLGGVPHSTESTTFHCGNWWTRSNSLVKRSIFMDDFVYSVARDGLQVSRLDDLEHPVASVRLGVAP